MAPPSKTVAFGLNGHGAEVPAEPERRLVDALRQDLGLTGTKIGCDTGDCGLCLVLIDGRPARSCKAPVSQVDGCAVRTVEGILRDGALSKLQQTFIDRGAAQCGFCTPAMLIAAHALLVRNPTPDAEAVRTALAGIPCRCTGYKSIVEAVLAASADPPALAAGQGTTPVGARLPAIDAKAKVTGAERFAADLPPDPETLYVRIVDAGDNLGAFVIGNTAPFLAKHPGIVRLLTAADSPGRGGSSPFAENTISYRGQPVGALVGDQAALAAIDVTALPIEWKKSASGTTGTAREWNVVSGDTDSALADSHLVVETTIDTSLADAAILEPETASARRKGNIVEITAGTTSPCADRARIAAALGLTPDQVRIVAAPAGGARGDSPLSTIVALAAWLTGRPARCTPPRAQSLAMSPKRPRAKLSGRAACDQWGYFAAMDAKGQFDIGADAETDAGLRFALHAPGPFYLPAARAKSRAEPGTAYAASAGRGLGTAEAALLYDSLVDELADQMKIDPLQFRWQNALRRGLPTPSGQWLTTSVGLKPCLDALRPRWQTAREDALRYNTGTARLKRGVGIACGWSGIGAPARPDPAVARIGLGQDGLFTLYADAADGGAGAGTALIQIAAETLGLPTGLFRLAKADTDIIPDAGPPSASRRIFILGQAVRLAASDLKRQILALAAVGTDATLAVKGRAVTVTAGKQSKQVDFGSLASDSRGDTLIGSGSFDPPTLDLDAAGQGLPHAVYAFAAQLAEVVVDTADGSILVLRVTAAQDVGRAINPTLIEGHIHGGIVQGLGWTLFERYVPAESASFKGYRIPMIADMPTIETILIEDPEPLGPFGAKSVRDAAFVPTAPAILNAVFNATGARIVSLPATPPRVLASIREAERRRSKA